MTFLLVDTFNNRIISAHRTLEGLVEKRKRYAREIARHNGRGSYIPTEPRVAMPRKGSTSRLESSRPLSSDEVAYLMGIEEQQS